MDMTAAGARNDDASSIKVHGGENCCAVVYEHGMFDGWDAEFRQGDHPYGDFIAAGARNDRLSSIRVFDDGCPSDHDAP